MEVYSWSLSSYRKTCDTNRGWLLLSGLRMASKNCTDEEEFADPHQIHELELTPEGEEVGPLI
jgi:hypothetical protein